MMQASRTVRRRIGASALLGCVAVLAACANGTSVAQPGADTGQPQPQQFRVATVADGLVNPWGMAFLPGGDILVTERPGRLRIVRGGQLDPSPIAGTPQVWANGQGGLLDVALHPQFAQNRLVYLSYSKPGAQGATTAVVRGRLDGNRLADVQEIFEANAWGTARVHFGSRLAFDRDGYLYITVGDRGDSPDRGAQQRAQNLGDHAGTTLRLHDDGRVPRDNPFVGRQGALPEIYTYGNRNSQGMAMHPETGEIWQVEHGPRGGDELNLIQPGRNYGWPVVTHGVNYSGSTITERTDAPGMEAPVTHWTPSIAVGGMDFYRGSAFPGWRGNIFVTALAGQHLVRITMDGRRVASQERLLADLGHRFREVKVGPDGLLYLLVDAASAPMLRLEPAR